MSKVVIIGGDAAGMSAASKLKRLRPDAEIIVYEMSGETSYGACGLPYYISGANDEINRIRIRRPEQFIESGIKVKTFHKVIKVNTKEKSLLVKNLSSGEEITDTYDRLVVASGASPVIPPFQERNLRNIFTLKSINDAENICERAVSKDTKNAVIVGAGYIGLELAEAFWNRGLHVDIIEAESVPMRSMDEEFAEIIKETLKEHGVELHLSERVQSFQGDEAVQTVVTDKGSYPAELVVICAGVRPNTGFLADTNVILAENGAVEVDERMQSSDPDVFAAGDCATIKNKITGKSVYLPLGTNANKQGKVLGEVLGGKDTKLEGVLGTSMCRVINLELARTGINMADAERAGIPCKFVITDAMNCPPYFPEKHCMVKVKLFYNPENNVVLGAQLAGKYGAGTRIGVCAVAVETGITCEKLAMLDFGYSPTMAAIWDPVQVAAGMVK